LEAEVVAGLRLVITGAGGLLGSALLTKAKGHEVYSLYNQHVPSSGIPIRVDLQDRSQVAEILQKIQPDAIVHAAALTDVDKCEKERDLANDVNYEATKVIAECAKGANAFLVYVSTDYVFDGKKGMYLEQDEPRPINFYGYTKLKGEQAVREILSDHLIARASVIYGSTPSSGKVNFALWILDSLKEGRPITVAADQYVSPTLNTNLADMLMECLESRLTGTMHLAGATRLSRLDFASELCREWSLDQSLINPIDMSKMNWYAPRPRDSSLDVTKAEGALENRPATIVQSLRSLRQQLEVDVRVKGAG
jgi:dTDP-4-dehydrorhamnose reductase